MSTIRYQFSAISAAATDINGTSGRINHLLEDLKGLLNPMVSTWEGDAAVAYNAAQAKWDRSAAELNEILGAISRTVAQGNEQMSDINRAAAASWG
ncbi:WXG100 family type VII secretion target [Corynebacterium caspium]|uniref:WXG100 family type VII secretion target n=1 Tax=Corynebacterium caspium TaxID=234828 RepID=UPI00035E6FD9|nr:WXG100 family type VII secretion target [Corynebacterium caspium]WKD59806.1 6 kDa early secretory antigenic target [Corynebacterium caspium DSM 44850]